jgi:hypothetical protein
MEREENRSGFDRSGIVLAVSLGLLREYGLPPAVVATDAVSRVNNRRSELIALLW